MMKITLTLAQSCIFAARQSNVARLHSIPLFLHPAKGFSSVKKRSTTIINRRGGDKQFMATMSESNQDSNKVAKIYSNQEEEIELPISQFEYPLIDVDCNLLHEDLTGLLESSSSAYDEKAKSKYFNILHHKSTTLSNIRGMFSPSSTVDEAFTFHNALVESSNENRNNIDIRMSVGIHPYHTSQNELGGSFANQKQDIVEKIKTLLDLDKSHCYITCIGELGLDYSDGFPSREEQLPWFELQLELAKEYKMPLFIHERLAFDDTLSLIDEVFPTNNNTTNDEADNDKYSIYNPNIIIHCFTGKRNELVEYVRRGYYISLSGYILKSGDGPDEINQSLKDGIIPLDKLMIETDAPYMGFNSCRQSYYDVEKLVNEEFLALKSKKRKNLIKSIYPNVPSALPKVLGHVVTCLNEGRDERGEDQLDLENVASTLYKNSKDFFGIRSKV